MPKDSETLVKEQSLQRGDEGREVRFLKCEIIVLPAGVFLEVTCP